METEPWFCSVIVGASLLLGLALGGYFIGKGSARFRSETRTVTVKGLVEKEVKAVPRLSGYYAFEEQVKTSREAQTKISSDREATISFLKNQGFKNEDIIRQPDTHDPISLASEYGQNKANERFRYVVTNSLLVATTNIDLLTKALGATEELLKSGVLLDGQREENTANPRYIITTFNALRPQLLAEATKNARLTAQQFASGFWCSGRKDSLCKPRHHPDIW